MLAVLLVVGAVVAAPGTGALSAGDPVETLFQALVTAIITGVTLVLTVNQLVLSQELGSLADQRDRLQGAMEYREDADEFVEGGVSPAEPGAFLQYLVTSIGRRGSRLAEAVDRAAGGEGADATSAADYARSVAERAQSVLDRLSGRHFGDFGMLWAALHYDYSRQIQEGRSLLEDPDADLPGQAREGVREIVRGLILFASVREHFKTLYFERDLIDLSRALLALAVPALIVAVLVLLYFDAGAFPPDTILGASGAVWTVSVATTVAVAPFALLLSFILRIATVARRTLAAGPFVLHPEQETGRTFEAAGG